jgi:hypothetical protein
MKQGVGVVLFIGSFLVYPLAGYIALNSGLSLGEKATYTSIAYAVSGTSFFIGFFLLDPELITKIKNYFGLKTDKAKKS